MTSEANKALEIIYQGNIHGPEREYEIVKAALTRLSELEPIIQELVEARKLATPGEWVAYEGKVRRGGDSIAQIEGKEIASTWGQTDPCAVWGGASEIPDSHFIALAANRIAKIGGV